MVDKLEVGMKLHALYTDGEFYPAIVQAISSSKNRVKAPVKISFVGYDESTWKAISELRSKRLPKGKAKVEKKKDWDYSGLEKGMRLQAESDGKYYAAEVVIVAKNKPRAKAPVKVHWVGYTAASDEWLGADRLRSKALKVKANEPDSKKKATLRKKKLFVSGQITGQAWKACETWITDMPAETDIRISACPFNVPTLAEATPTFPSGVVKLDVPCFGRILDAVMELFAVADVSSSAQKMKIRIPEYKIDTFIKGKMQILRDMTSAARAFPDCTGSNLEAAAKLESFANEFESIDEKTIDKLDDWKAFVGRHVAPGWEKKLAFEHVLENFGFDDAFATKLRSSEVEVEDKKTGAKEVVTWQHRGLRWLAKALGGYKPVGCLADVVNLVFAMMGYTAADVAAGLSEDNIIEVIQKFKSYVEKKNLRKLWIPDHVILDCESDDMLLWCLLVYVHEQRKTKLSVMAQLPESADADFIANYCRDTLQSEVFRDPDSQNLKAIMHYWNSMLAV